MNRIMNSDWNEIARSYLDRFEDSVSTTIPLLQAIQSDFGYLPRPLLEAITQQFKNIQANQLYGVATFYAQFRFQPKGKYTIKACVGTACHVKGSEKILSTIYEKLGLREGHRTTEDMLFTVETVSCVGACGLAPVIVINEQVHGQVTSDKVTAIINEILTKEGAQNVPT
jgi:NADH-quinone oxidoreductase subunit E